MVGDDFENFENSENGQWRRRERNEGKGLNDYTNKFVNGSGKTSRHGFMMGKTVEYEDEQGSETNGDEDYLDGSYQETISSVFEDVSRKRRRVKVRRPENNAQSSCLNTNVLPDRFKNVFGFDKFNRMQSECFESIYKGDENCVISAPTGSGKTVLFELSILRVIQQHDFDVDNLKILYIAPTKSLCYEKYKQWDLKFIGLSVGMLTSDTNYSEMERVRKANIIITTPEKWDFLTRKWDDYSRLFELIKVILVDEIHTLKERRGSALEVVITRMNYMYENIRIVAVSATIPNIDDVAEWLRSQNDKPAKVLTFDDSYRQVQLEKFVYGLNFNNKNDFQKDSMFNQKLDEIILRHSEGRPVLIFCPTRASTTSTAKYIAQECTNITNMHGKPKNRQSIYFNDKNLSECHSNGVVYHNAGLSLDDRRLVEQEFINGNITIICSTSTLAVGVNLPAYLVIIKGTRMWSMSESHEYSDLDILQMIGRAGRPQYETKGCGVILTENTMKTKYENMVNETEELNSSLHLDLIEHLAAEISLGTVTSTESATIWLKSTFFYVRFIKAPNKYPQLKKYKQNSNNLEQQLAEFCKDLLKNLLEYDLIEKKEDLIRCTAFGYSLARHYISFKTMKNFMKCRKHQTFSEILLLLSQSEEYHDIRVRHNEKRLYKEINSSPLIKFPFLTDKKQTLIIDQNYQKVSLLVQYELGGLEFPSYNGALRLHQPFIQDKMTVFRHGHRLLRCMIDTFICKKDAISLSNSLTLLRCANGNCWEDTAMVLRQLKNVGLVSVRKFVKHGVTSMNDIKKLGDDQIEYYLNLKTGNGLKIRRDLESLPKLEFRIDLINFKIEEMNVRLQFQVEISAKFTSSSWHGQSLTVDIQTMKPTGELLDFRRIKLFQLKSPKSYKLEFCVSSRKEVINFLMNCQEVAGIGKTVFFSCEELPSSVLKEQNILQKDQKMKNNSKFKTSSHLLRSESFSSSDDSLVHYLDRTQHANNEKNNIEAITVIKPNTENVKDRSVKENGNYECHHTCKDKQQCRHLCCKEGIPPNCIRHTHRNQTANYSTKIAKDTIHDSKKYHPKVLNPTVVQEAFDERFQEQEQAQIDNNYDEATISQRNLERNKSSIIEIDDSSEPTEKNESTPDTSRESLCQLEFLGSDVELA